MGVRNILGSREECVSGKEASAWENDSGQMTVEFMVALPVLLIVAVIATNALLFFSECAAFDRVARDAVRVHACSPTYGQTSDQSSAQVEQVLQACFEKEYLDCAVTVSNASMGQTTYVSTLTFYPTLFGMGLRSEILGVELFGFTHVVEFTIAPYRPGVLL